MKLGEYLDAYKFFTEMDVAMRDNEKADDVAALLGSVKGKKFSKDWILHHLAGWGFSQAVIDKIIEKLDERGMLE